MVNVAIIEDEAGIRGVVERFVNRQTDFQCVLSVDSVGAFFEQLDTARSIQVLLLDIMLRGQNSIGHIATIKKVFPDTKIIIFTMYRDIAFVRNAIEEGAHGYYVKGSEPAKLLDIIAVTLRGGLYLDPYVTSEFIGNLLGEQLSAAKDHALFNPQWDLTPREEQIAAGLLAGKAYKEIGATYNISIDTVRHHTKNLYKKLGVHSRGQLLKKLQEKT